MAAVEGDTLDPEVERRYRNGFHYKPPVLTSSASIVLRFMTGAKSLCDRYHRRTSEVREYLLKKGVTP